MKELVFDNLIKIEVIYHLKEEGREKPFICDRFIECFFGLDELPKKINKMTIVKNKAGFLTLTLEDGTVKWGCNDKKSFSYITKTSLKKFDNSLYHDEEIVRLMGKEKQIRVDVYIEYDQENFDSYIQPTIQYRKLPTISKFDTLFNDYEPDFVQILKEYRNIKSNESMGVSLLKLKYIVSAMMAVMDAEM